MSTYSYDRMAASTPYYIKLADKVQSQSVKALQGYGKANSNLTDLKRAISDLEPTFNTMNGNGEIEGFLRGMSKDLREVTDLASKLSTLLAKLNKDSGELVSKVKAYGNRSNSKKVKGLSVQGEVVKYLGDGTAQFKTTDGDVIRVNVNDIY